MTTETLTRPAPVEPTTPIKPSEAIRLGCLLAPVQAFAIETVGSGTACATYAALLGGGLNYEDWGGPRTTCPDCTQCDPGFEPFVVAVHLNDDHRWTREAIADWLAGQGL